MVDLDQTQAINLDDLGDETDEEQDNRPIAHLKVPCQKGFPGRMFPLYEGDNLIGRQDTCSVFLPLKALSREHACIEIRGDNHMICDKNSRNRTRRGKMFLLPEVRYEIKHNDTLMFGDVSSIYLVGSHVNDGDDTGSDTESESMFHTVPDEINDETPADSITVLAQKGSANKKELVDQSDASSDMLEPSQPSITVAKGNRLRPGLFSVDMDSERVRKEDQDLTVKETPAVGRTRTAFTGTLILPESESETEDESEKSDLLACPTLAMEDTFPEPARKKMLESATQGYVTESDEGEETIDSPNKSLLGASTQAYPAFEEGSEVKSKRLGHLSLLDASTQAYTAVTDTDEESDASEILCETIVTNIDAAMDLGPTQACSTFEESSPSKLKKECYEKLLGKKHEEEEEEEELIIEEEEEIENEIVKNLFMSPTLACDNEPTIPENEEETFDLRKSDDNSATQVFVEDEALTQALPMCDATKKMKIEEDEQATQVFEDHATQEFIKGITPDGTTQVLDDLPSKTRNQKVDPEEVTTQLCTEDVPNLAVADAVQCGLEKISFKNGSRNLRNVRALKPKPNEATLALPENNITLPISDGGDATLAVSVEATVTINGDEDNNTHKGTILASEDEPTQVFIAEETFLLEVPSEKPVIGRTLVGGVRQTKDEEVGVMTEDLEEDRITRGRRRQEKESCHEESVTQAVVKVNDALSTAKTPTRKSGRKSTVAASRKSKETNLVEEATQAYGKEDLVDEEEEEATEEVPVSNLKDIENSRVQMKDNLNSNVGKKTEDFKSTQTYIMEVKKVEEPTQSITSDATLDSPAFEPTYPYEMAVNEEATQAYADEKDHVDAIDKNGKREQPIRKSSRKSKRSAEAAGDVHASMHDKKSTQRNIDTAKKKYEVENVSQTEQATETFIKDGDDKVPLPSLQEVTQKQDVKRNTRETRTSTSSKRISRSQEKVSETPQRGIKQDENKESDLVRDLLNLPALRQATPEATQAYGMKEDASPPLSADASSSPEAFLKSPVFPLPSASPLKPALASSTRKKSPSPKCVTFAQEENTVKEPMAVLKDKRTRRSLKMDLAKTEEPSLVSVTKNRRGQMNKNSKESADEFAIQHESVDGTKETDVPKSNSSVRKSGRTVTKDQGEFDKDAETKKRLKRGSLQPEPAKTGHVSKRSRRNVTPPIVDMLKNSDSERIDVNVQNSLSDELAVGDSKKRMSRSRGNKKDDKYKKSIGDKTCDDAINHPTEITVIENDIMKENEADSSRHSNKPQGKRSEDAKAIGPESLIGSDNSNDCTQKKMSHEKSSNSMHENDSIKQSSGRKSLRGKNSYVEGDMGKDTKINSVRQASIEPISYLATSAKTSRRRATIATGAVELEPNNQPAAPIVQFKGRTTRQRVDKIEKSTAHSPKQSDIAKDKTDNSQSQERPSSAREKSSLKKGSKESNDSQHAKGRKRGSEPTLQTSAKQAKVQDESSTPKRAREKEENGINSPSLRRTSVAPTKPKVMFTGVSDDQGEKIVKDLGGELADSVYTCTHLVTDKIRRTVKLLCCLGRGVPIVSQAWLNSCKQSGMFLDPGPFLLQDSAAEKQYKFSLQLSLSKAGANLMLAGYKVHVTKNVKPEPQQMKDILKCAGAQYLASMPKSVDEKILVVSCDEDKSACTALNSEIPVVSAEFVLTGILRQEVDVNSFRLFAVPDSNRKRPTSFDKAEAKQNRR